MLHIVTLLVDSLFPPRPQEMVVRTVTDESLARLYCPGVHLHIDYLCDYQRPTIHALITENKYYANTKATKLLAKLLSLHINQDKTVVLIPIPLHPRRERERGYNQVTVVLQASHHTIDSMLLKRTAYTKSQTKLNKSERLKNLDGAFAVDTKRLHTYENTNFIIVDDVLTTGATMAAARRVLQEHLPPTCTLTCLALAH